MEFYSPWAFLVLLVVPVMVWLRARRSPRARVGFSTLAHLQRMPQGWRTGGRRLLGLLRIVCVVLLVMALARPRQGNQHSRVTTRGVAMQLVVDRSGSMRQEMDFRHQQQTRLDVVKTVLQEFVAGNEEGLEGRPNDLLGLIRFARYAETACPLVHAHDALLGFLAETDFVPRDEDGTSIGDALALAVARLETAAERLDEQKEKLAGAARSDDPDRRDVYTIESKVIVLLSDGANESGEHEPLEAAEWAREKGIRIYTIGIGGEISYARVQTMFGEQVVPMRSNLDEKLLSQIADKTGGFYARAENGQALRDICARIDELEKSELESIEYSSYEERYRPWLWGALASLGLEVLLGCTVLRKIP